jgi:hypothetical protein
MKILAKKNPAFIPYSRKDFTDKEVPGFRGDISDIMNSEANNIDYSMVPNFKPTARYIWPTPKELQNFHRPMFFLNDDKNLPVIFAYKDSFFGELQDFVSEHFSKSYYVNEFPCDLNYETIKNYHPNVVIQEFWEGRVEVVLSQCKN